jgi:KRAB domain-containing zinc finger protein
LRYINDAKGVGKKEANIEFLQSRRRFRGYYITEVYATKDIKGDNYWSALKQWYEEQHPFACEHCDFRSAWKDSLDRHNDVLHTDVDRIECDYCDETFARKAAMIAHLNTHTGEIIYRCTECDFISLAANELSYHRQAKHAVAEWKCFECDKVFSSSCNLETHPLAIHTDEKPYACDHCDKKFGMPQALKDHVGRIHEKKRPFSCDDCDYTAFKKTEVNEHRKNMHPSDDDDE